MTEIRTGDTEHAEPSEVYCHGAAPHSLITHLAIQEAGPDGTVIEWGNHVSDPEFQGSTISASVRRHFPRRRLLTGDLTGRAGPIDRVDTHHQITLPPGRRPASAYIPSDSPARSPAAGLHSSLTATLRRNSAPGLPSSNQQMRSSVVLAIRRSASRRPSSLAIGSPVTSRDPTTLKETRCHAICSY